MLLLYIPEEQEGEGADEPRALQGTMDGRPRPPKAAPMPGRAGPMPGANIWANPGSKLAGGMPLAAGNWGLGGGGLQPRKQNPVGQQGVVRRPPTAQGAPAAKSEGQAAAQPLEWW